MWEDFKQKNINYVRMGCRQTKPKQQQDPLPLLNMLILGFTGSGKTTILNQLKGQPEATCTSELGIDNFIINKKVKIMAFQVAGRACNSWHNYYDTSNIVMFVVDANKVDEFSKVAEILKQLDQAIADNAQIIVVFNKVEEMVAQVVDQETSNITDILDRNSKQVKQLDKFRMPQLKHNVYKCKCSGKTRLGINSLIKKIYSLAYRQAYGTQWNTSQKQ